jgi:hypothetical protein
MEFNIKNNNPEWTIAKFVILFVKQAFLPNMANCYNGFKIIMLKNKSTIYLLNKNKYF